VEKKVKILKKPTQTKSRDRIGKQTLCGCIERRSEDISLFAGFV
jgi:hypothetical protein